MTQEDLQRDVEMLEEMRVFVGDSVWRTTLDRAIATARVRASMSDEQRAYLVEHHTNLAEYDENEALDLIHEDETGLTSAQSADAHRKVARLLGGET